MHQAAYRDRALPWLLLGPQLLILLVFFYWPACQALWQAFSLTDAFGGNPQFVGLDNFRMLLSSPEYHQSIRITFVFSALVAGIALAIGLLLALLVDRLRRGASGWRLLLIWPYAVAPAIVGLLWTFLMDPHIGIVAFALTNGLGVSWMPSLNPTDALALVVMAAVWKQVSYNFIFFLAGLQAIPKALIEQAAIDGSGAIRRIKDVVFPLLAPTSFFLLVMNVVYAFFDTFGIVHVTTKGGPGGGTTILAYKAYRDGFVSQDFGSSGAQSAILMTMVVVLTVVQFRLVERRVHYGS